MSLNTKSLNNSKDNVKFSFDTSAVPFNFEVKESVSPRVVDYPPRFNCEVKEMGESSDSSKVFEYPWWTSDYFSSDEDIETACHKEVCDFVKWLSPTPEEVKMRDDVSKRIQDIVYDLWPEARVELFGSYVTDLCVPTSDIDMVIFDTGCDRLEALFTLSNELETRGICRNPELITWAKVPIIKLKDIKSGGCLVDISFDAHNGPQNTLIIKRFMEEYPLVKPLSLVVKYFLKQKYLNDTWNGGIGSYTLVLMIISFIQLHVSSETEEEEINLAQLLIEFFNLYGTKFDYLTNAISILEGKYVNKELKNWLDESNPDLLSIEDPHNPEVDVGTLSFKISSARNAFQEAYEKLSKFPERGAPRQSLSFVSQLIYLSYRSNDMRFRETVRRNYGNKIIQKPIHISSKTNSSKRGRRTKFTMDIERIEEIPQGNELEDDYFPPLGSQETD